MQPLSDTCLCLEVKGFIKEGGKKRSSQRCGKRKKKSFDFVQLRIAALNEDDSGEEESQQQDEPATTKEAEVMYNTTMI